MDVPYGFDCFAFQRDEIKHFKSNSHRLARPSVLIVPKKLTTDSSSSSSSSSETRALSSTRNQADYVKFTRKNEDYPHDQLLALGQAGRLNMSELDKRIFCGIKIQIGIGVATSFLRKGLQYKQPIRGRSELVNGSWTGIMKGLTIDSEAPASYDLALGNFLAWDEEFPHIKFGPFFAVESKLVFLTGSSRRVETSSFGTNVTREIWITILAFLVVLSLLAAVRTHWQHSKRADVEEALEQLMAASGGRQPTRPNERTKERKRPPSIMELGRTFFFIYFTMLLNKPSVEFDDLIWPRDSEDLGTIESDSPPPSRQSLEDNKWQAKEFEQLNRKACERRKKQQARGMLPTSIRALSYMWSAACLVLASIYSGEMLAVMLLHTDQNIDTISQLINSKPPIEPVIRQDDFTYNLMLKSLDVNMLRLHNITKIIPRADVYTRQFIESVSERKVALLGDDELIETIYDLYHKYYPLYKSKVSYLQYPISMMYRKDLDVKLEGQLRRGMVQIFEMGLIHRWYQAQKDTYIQFYDAYERNKTNDGKGGQGSGTAAAANSERKYKPLSIHHFVSFYRAMFLCGLFALLVLLVEILHSKVTNIRSGGC